MTNERLRARLRRPRRDRECRSGPEQRPRPLPCARHRRRRRGRTLRDARRHAPRGELRAERRSCLSRSFANDRLIGQSHVSEEKRLAFSAFGICRSRRRKRQHICRGVLAAEGLVQAAHLCVGKQRNADAVIFRRKARRAKSLSREIWNEVFETRHRSPTFIFNNKIRASSGGLTLAARRVVRRRRRSLNSCIHTSWHHNNLNLALCFISFNDTAHKRMANDIRASEGNMGDSLDIGEDRQRIGKAR